MWFAPKIATVIDVLTRPRLRRAFGGTARFLASVRDRDAYSSSCCRRSCGSATRCSSPACRSAGRSAGSARCATITPCRGRQSLQQFWPHTLLGFASLVLILARPTRRHSPMRCSLPAGPRCRSRSRSSPRGLRSAGCSRGSASAGCRKKPRRPGARSAGAARGQRRARRPKPCSTRLRTARGVMRSLGIYYGRRGAARARDGRAVPPVRQARAIWCSTSAPMSATASPRSAGSARSVVAVEPQPRARRRTLRACSMAATQRSRSSAVAVGRAAGEIAAEAQHRQSDSLDRLRRFRASRARRARLGGPALGQDRSRCR